MGSSGAAVVDLCGERNGVESARDWVGTDMVVCIPGASLGAAAKLFAEKVNTE